MNQSRCPRSVSLVSVLASSSTATPLSPSIPLSLSLLYLYISPRSHLLSLYVCIFTICSSSCNKTKIFGKRTLPWYMCIWLRTLTRLSSLQTRVLQQFIVRVWQLVQFPYFCCGCTKMMEIWTKNHKHPNTKFWTNTVYRHCCTAMCRCTHTHTNRGERHSIWYGRSN